MKFKNQNLMCRRPKSKHTEEEMLACIRKMDEFKKQKDGGAGIQQQIIKISDFFKDSWKFYSHYY